MRKHHFTIILLIILFSTPNLAYAITYSIANVFISEISPTNLSIGQTVNGQLVIEVTCLNDQYSGTPSIDFGDGSVEEQSGGSCLCVSVSSSSGSGPLGLGDAEVKKVRCSYPFSHAYNNAGTFTVIPKTTSSTIGGSVTTGSSSTGQRETVTVAERATPAPIPGGSINPLVATTTVGLIKDITDRIFIYLSALAVLFVMIGGFNILTAAGSPTQVTKGRKIIVFTIIGYALILLARGIALLIVRILGINVVF